MKISQAIAIHLKTTRLYAKYNFESCIPYFISEVLHVCFFLSVELLQL